MFNRTGVSQVSGRLVDMLDQVEKRIELLREHATSMEQERDCLLSMLQTIMTNKELQSVTESEREEIEVTAQRLLTRTLTVEVAVSTPRNDLQQKALNRINDFINMLVQKIQIDLESAREACKLYLNSCLSDGKGPIDQRFQAVIIECTADDQKKTRKRLESLLTTIIHAEGTLQNLT